MSWTINLQSKRITQRSNFSIIDGRFRAFSGTVAALLLSSLYTLAPAEAAPIAPGDYDGDGRSDLAMTSVNRTTKTTTWTVRFGSGEKRSFGFSVAADAMAPGFFFGETNTNPAVVFVRDASEPLEWYVRGNNGSITKRDFGTPGGSPIEGDFDCDGATDLAIRNLNSKGEARWTIARSTGGTETVTFGKTGQRAFGADADGDGCSELISVRNSKGGLYWDYRKLSDPAVSTVQWGLSGDIPLQPYDLNSDGAPDFIIVRELGGTNTAFIRFSAQASTIQNVGPRNTVPLTGNFTGTPGFAYFDRPNRMFNIINADSSISQVQFGYKTGALIRPDGSVVQPDQDERLGEPRSSGDEGGGDSGGKEGICDSTKKNRDGAGGFVNNPANSRGKMKIILPSSYNGKFRSLKVYKKGGQFVDTLKQATPNEWGNRPRFYGSKSLGSLPTDLLVQVLLSSGNRDCFAVPNPRERVD